MTRRAGTSLVELLVALVLFGIVGTATLRSLDRQARFHAGILTILQDRSQHAATHEAIAVEMRGLSPGGGDINRLSDSAIVFRLPVGTGVACALAAGVIALAPDRVAAGQTFAGFRATPQQGDTAWLFDEGASDVAGDDSWRPVHVTAVARATGQCATSSLVHPTLDVSRVSWRLSFAGTLPASLSAGAPVRLTRIARFALYRGGTGEHWLGYSEILPATGGWITIQPVAGPYLAFSSINPAGSGIALNARDSSGAAVPFSMASSSSALALASRTRTTRSVRMDGLTRGLYRDSLRSLIGMRNAR